MEDIMSSIFKIAMFIIGVFSTINWVADNPQKMEAFRTGVNDAIDATATTTTDVVNGVTKN